MKKKGHRDVPDFSRHPTQEKGAPREAAAKKPAPASTRQTVKPQATSAKSGRRGQ